MKKAISSVGGLGALSVVVCVVLLAGCGGPRVIPNDKLAHIFHDLYLTNAYTDSHAAGLDSLNLYEPIFERYGYTSEDMRHTIGSFAKRKSARLSDDVVERTVEMLAAESRFYARRIAIHDTIGLIAREKFASVVYTDTLIRVRRMADTARLRIVIPLSRAGSYELSYRYFVDSTDLNSSLRSNVWLLDERGGRSGGSPRYLRRRQRESVTVTLDADEHHRRMMIDLGGYTKNMTTPSIRIDTLVVRYLPPDSEVRRALLMQWVETGWLDSLRRHYEKIVGAPVGKGDYIFRPEGEDRTSSSASMDSGKVE